MKKLFSTFLLIGLLFPVIAEAGVSPEGRHRPRKRCRTDGQVVVCRMPRKPKCTRRRPCIPRGYYRPSPPRSPMPLL